MSEKLKKNCRLCLNQLNEEATNIFGIINLDLIQTSNTFISPKQQKYSDFLMKCSSLKLDEYKNISDKMCKICTYKVTEFYYYVLHWQFNENKFQSLLNADQQNEIKLNNHINEYNGSLNGDVEFCFEEKQIVEDKLIVNNLKKNRNKLTINKKIANNTKINKIVKKNDDKQEINEICFENFKEQSNIKHVGQQNIETTYDNIELDQKTKTQLKKTTDNNYFCDICTKTFKNSKTLEMHFELHIVLLRELLKFKLNKNDLLNETNILCLRCMKQFTDCVEFSSHLNLYCNSHVTCTVCNVIFDNIRVFQEHLSHTHKIGCYVCTKCLKSFRTFEAVKTHVYKHNQMTKTCFSCVLCFTLYSKYEELYEHMLTHSGKFNTCSFCAENFDTKIQLSKHKRKIHHDKSIADVPCCNICGRNNFITKYKLYRHLRNHKSQLQTAQCPLCNKIMRTKDVLRTHLRIHRNDRRHVCSECGKRFYQTGSLYDHMKQRHSNERPYKCIFAGCDKAFKTTKCLNNHIKIHTGDKRHKCETCGKKFYQKGPLTLHMRMHTGERPYVCKICGKSYTSGARKNRHFKKKHPELIDLK